MGSVRFYCETFRIAAWDAYSHHGAPPLLINAMRSTRKKLEDPASNGAAEIAKPNMHKRSLYLAGDWTLGCSSVSLEVRSGDDVLGNLIVASMVAARSPVVMCNK